MTILESIISNTPLWYEVLICLALTVFMSVAFGVIYCFIKQKDGYTKDIPLTLAILPIVICGLSLLVGALMINVPEVNITEVRYGRVAVALLAAFIVIKFRSQQRTTEDLTYIFFLTAIGICNGLGYIYFSMILYAVVLILFIVLHFANYPMQSKRNLNLKVTIPEDLNFEHVFDDIFEKYTSYHQLTKVKTSDMGTMFVLNYEIIVKNGISTKEMIDEIRSRNGNLNVVMTVKKYTTIE